MPHLLENTVRREQVKLLKFEKFLRRIAPAVIATGLNAAGVQAASAELGTLENAKSVFARLENGAPASYVIGEAELTLSALIDQLSVFVPGDVRKESLLRMMETVDSAHQMAQGASNRHHIRLIGERRKTGKVDGGTPKISDNAAWFVKNYVDGGRPKVSDNAGWLRTAFGL